MQHLENVSHHHLHYHHDYYRCQKHKQSSPDSVWPRASTLQMRRQASKVWGFHWVMGEGGETPLPSSLASWRLSRAFLCFLEEEWALTDGSETLQHLSDSLLSHATSCLCPWYIPSVLFPPFLQQILPEHPLCARPCLRCWWRSREQDRKSISSKSTHF